MGEITWSSIVLENELDLLIVFVVLEEVQCDAIQMFLPPFKCYVWVSVGYLQVICGLSAGYLWAIRWLSVGYLWAICGIL